MSPDNLVSFPPNGSARPAGDACAEFCARWRGTDVAEGARLLLSVLPPRVPGALQLVIARALGELDVPPFASPEEFRNAVRRFAATTYQLIDVSDVRRARRDARVTFDRLVRETALPAYLVRQLEWGDFREWHHADWSRRVCHAYARAAGLDPERVHAIVEAERARQVARDGDAPAVPAVATASARAISSRAPATVRPVSRRRGAGFAAAAVVVFAAGLLTGGLLFDRSSAERPVPDAQRQVPIAAPLPPVETDAVPAVGTPAPDAPVQPDPAASPRAAPDAREERTPQRADAAGTRGEPQEPPESTTVLEKASLMGGGASFSPAFSNVGTAVFYHRDEGTGSSLVKADTDETTGGLRIVNIVQDGARNYHVKPSPDGSRIAFDSDRDGERGLYIANADGTNVRRVSGPGFAAVPSWSPDGTRLAFVRGEPSRGSRVWNLWLLHLASNTSVRLTSYRYGQPWGASWFPDGQRLAFSHEDRLTVLDLGTGSRRVFRSPRAGRLVRTPAVSPDGRHVVFQLHRDGAWLLDVRDGSMQRILADPTAEEFAWDSTGRKLAFHSRRSGEWSVWVLAADAGGQRH